MRKDQSRLTSLHLQCINVGKRYRSTTYCDWFRNVLSRYIRAFWRLFYQLFGLCSQLEIVKLVNYIVHFNGFQDVGTSYVMLDKLWNIAYPSYTWLTANYLNNHCMLTIVFFACRKTKNIIEDIIKQNPLTRWVHLQEILLFSGFTLIALIRYIYIIPSLHLFVRVYNENVLYRLQW